MIKRVMSVLLSFLIACSVVIVPAQADAPIQLTGRGGFSLSGSDGFAIDVAGDYAYIGAKDGGLRIFNLADKSAPVDITPVRDAYLGATVTDGNGAVLVHDGYLYVGFKNNSPGGVPKGVRKYSLDQPAAPELVTVYSANDPRDFIFHSGRLYVADRGAGLKIFSGNASAPEKTLKETGAEKVTGLAMAGTELFVSYADAGVLVYTQLDGGTPLLLAKRSITGTNVNEIAVSAAGIFLFDQGEKRITALNLGTIGGDLSQLANADAVAFTNGMAQFDARGGFLEGNILYASTGAGLYLFDVSDPAAITFCAKLDASALYFRKAGEYVFASARAAGIAIFRIGAIPPGQAVVPYDEKLQQLIEENMRVEPITFGDIDGHWAKAAIEKVANKGIMEGTAEGVFSPDGEISRAEFSAALIRTLGLSPVDYAGAYPDIIGGEWFAPVMQIAADLDFIDTGMLTAGSSVLPGQILLRQEMASMAVRGLEHVQGSAVPGGSGIVFTDQGAIASWAEADAARAAASGVLADLLSDSFLPNKPVTRGEAASVASRLLEKFQAAEIDLTVFRQAPVLMRVSDSVYAGNVFTVYGEGLAEEGLEVRWEKVASSGFQPAPGASAAVLAPVYTDAEGHYITLTGTQNLEPGAYRLWAGNGYGWSKPVYVNQARPQWLSSNMISPGNIIYLNGKNLDGREFGAPDQTGVRLVSGGQAYPAQVTDVNPFSVQFSVYGEVPLGEYTVELTNDGILWAPLESGQTLQVKAAPADPLSLGVAWAGEFHWERQFNVRNYGALGDGAADDTTAIQTAIQAAKNAGGGMVYLPEGIYAIQGLSLPGGIALLGDGMAETRLLYRPDVAGKTKQQLNAVTIIQSDSDTGKNGRQGIARLTMDIDRTAGADYQPQRYFWLGGPWNPADPATRTADYLFIKEVQVGERSFNWDEAEGQTGLDSLIYKTNMIMSANEHVLVEDNLFLGDNANLTSTYMNRYLSFRNNVIDTFYGNVYVHGLYTIYEHNSITRAPWEIGMDVSISRQGIYTRANSYVAHNTIVNTGAYLGDGEMVSAESYNGGTSLYGRVDYAGAASLKIIPKTNAAGFPLLGDTFKDPWNPSKKSYGDWYVMIVDGKGMGQSRKITASDKDTRTLKVEKPWTVVPDSTSLFTVYMPLDNMTFYQNEARDGSWGFLHYGPTSDTVIAGNTGYNIQCNYLSVNLQEVYAEDSADGMDCRVWFNYFNRSENNRFEGASWKSGIGGIALNVKYESGDLHGKHAYGIEIRNNTIIGDGKSGADIIAHLNALSQGGAKSIGYGSLNGIVLRHANSKNKPLSNGTHAVVIQGNTLSNIDRGITIGGHDYKNEANPSYLGNLAQSGSSGVVIQGNDLQGAQQPYMRYGDENTIILND